MKKNTESGENRAPFGFTLPVTLTAALCGFVFLILFTTMLFAAAGLLLLLHFHALPLNRPVIPFLLIALLSVVTGTALARLAAVKVFAPLRRLSCAAGQVAGGDFDVLLDEDGNIAEVRELTRSFNRMVRKLQSTELVHSDFVRNMSHEFKTPLSSIEGYATLMQNPSLSEQERLLYASRIIASTRRLTALTGNILLLSRLENQEISLSRQRFCLDEQLRQAVLLYEEQWSAKKLSLDLQLPSVSCLGNEELLFQVWQNLLGNAVKFADEGSELSLSLSLSDGEIRVSVADTGVPVPAADLSRIFEKFYQGEQARSNVGNGLGLALVRQIVQLHGGSVTAFSRERRTIFTVRLPQ
ncbi:MAG: HAMP domain-containing sensor histidine kinase [Eubacteriales bacterium]|nr:HAMP domain-containing sensor histidine kinase [Eubacteriales bacterium]